LRDKGGEGGGGELHGQTLSVAEEKQNLQPDTAGKLPVKGEKCPKEAKKRIVLKVKGRQKHPIKKPEPQQNEER